MSALLRKLQPYAFVVFRIAVGGLFLFHGLQKLFGWYGGSQLPLLSLRGAAGIIELAAGALVALGAWTVPAAFVASGEMLVAYGLAHHPRGGWPIENGGELALLYSAAFLYISTHGPGSFSLDALMRRR